MGNLFAEGQPMPSVDSWIQYGCFGLVAFIIFMAVWHGIPKMLSIHKETISELTTSHKAVISELVKTFNDETEMCRRERRESQQFFTDELEKNRKSKSEMAERFQQTIEKISLPKSG
jgi:hypothetical protein